MATVAIIGAGELGGATAWALAQYDRVGRVLLIDSAKNAAVGKALDIRQSSAVKSFHAELIGTDDLSLAVGCDVCIIAEPFGRSTDEWTGDEGLATLTRLMAYLNETPIVFAGSSQSPLLESVGRDLGVPSYRLVGSSPDAYASAIISIVALEARCSPREVLVTVLGAPGRFVIAWSEASIGGYALERVLTPVQLRRIDSRAQRLWPPGPGTLGTAAARVAAGMIESSRRSFNVLTILGGEFGVRNRVGAVPAVLSPRGIAETRVPELNIRERVQLDTALGS